MATSRRNTVATAARIVALNGSRVWRRLYRWSRSRSPKNFALPPTAYLDGCNLRRAADLVFMWVSITVGLALILTVALWLLGADVVVAWLIAITGITFLTYGYDKAVASSKATRVPEKALLALALVGGTLGAWAGMSAFHHKTAKESFRFKFVLVIIIQVVLLVVYFYFR
jgi:uncharacterized membrane protein YsdA (DUF1294 family)